MDDTIYRQATIKHLKHRLCETAASTMTAQAEIYTKCAILLEEIARAWPENSGHWIRWGQYYKCSRCGHMVEEQTDTCPECKAEMERVK